MLNGIYMSMCVQFNESKKTVISIFQLRQHTFHHDLPLEINDCADRKDLRHKLDAYKMPVIAHSFSLPRRNCN